MFSYISRLAGFYHLPTVESLAVRKYRHGPGSWPVTHRKTKTHTPRSKQLALRWCYFRKYLYRLATTNCGCWGAIYAGLGKSPKSKNARCISELLGDCLTKAPFWDETPAAESICIDSSIFLSVAHIYKYFKILIIPLYTYIIYIYIDIIPTALISCRWFVTAFAPGNGVWGGGICAWWWHVVWFLWQGRRFHGFRAHAFGHSCVTMIFFPPPPSWQLHARAEVFRFQVLKPTLSYTRQLPSEHHLSTTTGVATSPASAWLGRRAFKATASWKWCDVPNDLSH